MDFNLLYLGVVISAKVKDPEAPSGASKEQTADGNLVQVLNNAHLFNKNIKKKKKKREANVFKHTTAKQHM